MNKLIQQYSQLFEIYKENRDGLVVGEGCRGQDFFIGDRENLIMFKCSWKGSQWKAVIEYTQHCADKCLSITEGKKERNNPDMQDLLISMV